MSKIDSARFWSKVDYSAGPDACWPWIAAVRNPKKGYGCFGVKQDNGKWKICLASRCAWQLVYGTIPTGFFICHKCDNPRCVNPTHLFLGTNLDNMRDMAAKNRASIGERSGQAKLVRADVEAIRLKAAGGMSRTELAHCYGISTEHVRRLISGERWQKALTI